MLVFAVLGMGRAFLAPSRYENKRLQRFLAFYFVALLAGYSLITYKTPWIILGAEQTMVILAGLGAGALLDAASSRLGRISAWCAVAADGSSTWAPRSGARISHFPPTPPATRMSIRIPRPTC